MEKKNIIPYIKWTFFPFLYSRTKSSEVKYFIRRSLLEQNILHLKEPGSTHDRYCDHDIIVSLTTYGKRLYEVHLTIESIMEQTLKANRIVLWIDNSLKDKRLPVSLERLQDRGLEIRYCKDIRSYTKLIPSLKAFPDDAIITVDDDILYDFDVLERLINGHIESPELILANRMHFIKKKSNGQIDHYNKWNQYVKQYEAHPNNFPTGVGGVLYPPQCFDEEVFRDDIFLDICKYADDIWFKAMALKKGTLSKSVFTKNAKGEDYLINDDVQDVGLKQINVNKSLNDKQFNAVFERYDLIKKLK